MYERNQSVAFQTIFWVNFIFFFVVVVKNEKKWSVWLKLSYMYDLTIKYAYVVTYFLKIPTLKKFSPREGYFPSYWGSIAPMYCTKIVYDLTIANINKYFEFKNDWHKIIRFRYDCTRLILHHCVKEIKKKRITSELRERYTPKSNQL